MDDYLFISIAQLNFKFENTDIPMHLQKHSWFLFPISYVNKLISLWSSVHACFKHLKPKWLTHTFMCPSCVPWQDDLHSTDTENQNHTQLSGSWQHKMEVMSEGLCSEIGWYK